MKRAHFSLPIGFFILFAAVLSLAACTDDVEMPTAAESTEEGDGTLAKQGSSKGDGTQTSECGGRTELVDSRAILNFQDSFEMDGGTSVAAAIVSDDGLYIGGEDGVHAKIFYHDGSCSRSGDLVFSPDWDAKGNKKNARKLVFHFPENSIGLPTGGASSSVFLNFRGIMQLGSDVNKDGDDTGGRDAKIEEKNPGHAAALEYAESFYHKPPYPSWGIEGRRFRINVEFDGCDYLEYDNMKVTRTSDVGAFAKVAEGLGQWSHVEEDLGSWLAESVPTSREVDGTEQTGHWGRCMVSSGQRDEPNGEWMDMPFNVTVTEHRP